MRFLKTIALLLGLNLILATGFPATLAQPAQPAQPAQGTGPIRTAIPTPAPRTSPPAGAANPKTGGPAEDIRDIRGPISIPYSWLWAAYLSGGFVLAAALYGAWRWYRAQARERAREPYEIALERLEKARELMQPERGREYSFAVSEITRTYIEARFQERAARRTTEEFLRDLLTRAENPLSQHRALLEDFLQYCDLAKFAKWYLTLSDMESMHESARAFILETRPQPAGKATLAPKVNGSLVRAAEPQLTQTRP